MHFHDATVTIAFFANLIYNAGEINLEEAMPKKYITQQEIENMSVALKSEFKRWLKSRHSNKTVSSAGVQLVLDLDKTPYKSPCQHRIKLTELLDAGLIFPRMPVRVRLIRKIADELERTHISGMVVSANGCIAYKEIEYERPSPLAEAVNRGRAVNGWEYVEVKTRKGSWVKLEQLRKRLKNDFPRAV